MFPEAKLDFVTKLSRIHGNIMRTTQVTGNIIVSTCCLGNMAVNLGLRPRTRGRLQPYHPRKHVLIKFFHLGECAIYQPAIDWPISNSHSTNCYNYESAKKIYLHFQTPISTQEGFSSNLIASNASQQLQKSSWSAVWVQGQHRQKHKH